MWSTDQTKPRKDEERDMTTFLLILSLWTNAAGVRHYYRWEMTEIDCRAMQDVIEEYSKLKSPDVHAVCVPKGSEGTE